MPTNPIASHNKSERLFILYQCMPRGKEQALSLTELMSTYGNDPACFTSERKNLENDLISLKHIFETVFYSEALVRVPAWEQNISGKTPKFYIEPNFSIDVINEQTLFFWEMLSNYTANYLPVSIQQTIRDKLSAIRRHDRAVFQQSSLGQWHNHLLTLPSMLQAPKLDSEVLASIHQALLQSRQLTISYYKKWHDLPKQRVIYPKGLVFIDNMMYLSGFDPVEDNIDDEVLLAKHRNFAVCRIVTAQVIEEPMPDWVERDVFTLKSLQQLGKLELTDKTKIDLILQVQKYACQHLYERPLSADQKITVIEDDWYQVTATVANTQRLQDWLVSMSQLSVVIAPIELKKVILERLQNALALYDS